MHIAKYILASIIIVSAFSRSYAQEKVDNSNAEKSVYTMVEQMPEFPGGDKALYEYLKNNTKYPEAAIKSKTEGRVFVQFVITEVGALENIVVKRGLSPELNDEAIRVVKGMPAWVPGKQNGRKVSVYYMIPIVFKLQEGK